MYALDLSKSQFWLGEIDSRGQITGFTDFELAQPLPAKNRSDNVFYYVQIEEEGDGELHLHVLRWYMAFPKTEKHHRSIAALVEAGLLDPIDAANKILLSHRKQMH